MEQQALEDNPVSVDEIYRQQYGHFSRMNDLFYKLPIGFSTIIGGLWFFGAGMIEKDTFISAMVFAFAALCCVAFFLMMERFGAAFNAYIDNLNILDGKYKVTIKKARWRSSKRVVMSLLVCAFILSLSALIYVVSR
jgi:uncharacterized membrane protein